MSNDCPICKHPVQTPGAVLMQYLPVGCPRCGRFLIDTPALQLIEKEFQKSPSLWAVTSHALRRGQDKEGKEFVVTEKWLRSVWAQPRLANPHQQANTFIELLGLAELAPAEYAAWNPTVLCGLVGTADSPIDGKMRGLTFVLDHLKSNELIEELKHPPPGPARHFRLTFSGWDYFENLRRSSVESRTAFMAMGFHEPSVQLAFAEFVKGVAQTGFELRRLDQKPKAGLIDNRMRVEIRAAKFMVADLTDENRGAYWEAGFAEGASKKVYYTLRGIKI
jgi:hypothetical protein